MITDLVRRSLGAKYQVIPVESLLGDCLGSRMPDVDKSALTQELAERAAQSCPTSAIELERSESGAVVLRLDYGGCIGCGKCIEAAAPALTVASKLTHCGVARNELVRRWDIAGKTEIGATKVISPEAVKQEISSMLGRALNVRQLDAGSCNGCEAEIVALTNPYYDLERFGVHFVASPKHADMLLVTGPVTRNMAYAVTATFEAVPAPKLVVAVGACGCSGGIFGSSYAVAGSVGDLLPVDGYIPGCPPTPAMLVSGILEVLRRYNKPSKS